MCVSEKAIEDQKSQRPTRKGLLISRYGIELVILETAALAGLTRCDSLEDEPAAARKGTGWINMFDISSHVY
uniref:Uncharacterized protein n=1 Tax=Brassica oleracea TaxID=3712 RepID=A0A3P6BLG3_BRAOL|nr:unnamed protein product [Brassica oleracea]